MNIFLHTTRYNVLMKSITDLWLELSTYKEQR